MKYLRLSNEQRTKLIKLINEFDEPGASIHNWFEYCFRFLAPKVAESYCISHQTTTISFAKFMILQKLTEDLDNTNPVDLLYDIWNNPKDYRIDL